VFSVAALPRFIAIYPTRADELAARAVIAADNTARLNSAQFLNGARPVAAAAARAAISAARAVAGTYASFAANATARAAYAARVASAAEEIWDAVSHDANFVASGGTAQALASKMLWHKGAPTWVGEYWWLLQVDLLREDGWQVWIDWYNRRIEGVSEPEEIELVFATVPDKEREAGPATANKWIKERLEELQKKDSPPSPKSAAPPQPIENLPSPFTFGRNAAGQITIVAGPQNTPVIAFPGDDATHRRWLETGRKLTERLIADLQAGKFNNVRSDYREGLERYVSDLPPEPRAGNFLLADAEARALRGLFAAEPHILAEPFAARLKIVLENHFALLGFYPEVARYIAAAREGQVTAPLPQEAIAGFGKVVLDNTPLAFTPEVSQGLREAEREAPKVELEPEDVRGGPPPVKPPAYPYDEPDPEKSHWYSIASSFNALYKAVWNAAKNDPKNVVAWIAILEKLTEYAKPIIEWLKTFTPPAF
jgi:DNA segregation ATPase FtsK/SpoIIIE-like protein